MQAPLPPPAFDLAEPGTFVFDGPAATRGYALNRFALSLKQPANRARFLTDERTYVAAWNLSDTERALVAARNWTGLLQAGGHLQAVLKLAATVGQSLYDIGGHNCGVGGETMMAACPRRVSELGSC